MAHSDEERTVSLHEERIDITKVEAVTDRLYVSTRVDERAVLVEDTVERGQLTIEPIAVDRAATHAPEHARTATR